MHHYHIFYTHLFQKNKYKSILFLLVFFCSSCKKFLEIPPPANQVISSTAFSNDANATAAIMGIYSEMMNGSNQFSSGAVTLYAGMAADELYYYTAGSREEFVNNNISLANHGTIEQSFWNPAYKYIYAANSCIEGLASSTGVTPSLKSTLSGEAKFIRAFCYFHLVNLFGDVPLITTTNYRISAGIARTPAKDIYHQITSDLIEAEQLLPGNYPAPERTRPNKWAAATLLARVYLYQQDWVNAEAQATQVINSGMYQLNTVLSNVFLKNSAESIWQLPPVNPARNTWEGYNILPASTSSTPTYLLTNTLLNAFETGDNRKTAWISSRQYAGHTVYYPFKYKVYGNNVPVTEYYTVFRLAEPFLIRAEARAQQGGMESARQDLNQIRKRAGLNEIETTDKSVLLSAIEHERRIELFAEWGNRWYDLKRTGRIDAVLGVLKPATWQPTDALWPIPTGQLNANPTLTQNPGY